MSIALKVYSELKTSSKKKKKFIAKTSRKKSINSKYNDPLTAKKVENARESIFILPDDNSSLG